MGLEAFFGPHVTNPAAPIMVHAMQTSLIQENESMMSTMLDRLGRHKKTQILPLPSPPRALPLPLGWTRTAAGLAPLAPLSPWGGAHQEERMEGGHDLIRFFKASPRQNKHCLFSRLDGPHS